MSHSNAITHLVFDMGGVLIRLQWLENVGKLLGRAIEPGDIHLLWENSPSASGFDKGHMDFDAFYQGFQKDFDISIPKPDFEQCFADMIQEDDPLTLTVLRRLKKDHSLSLLSNTNPYHWAMIQQRNSFLPLFEHQFTSIELGLMKPDPDIYRHVQDALGVEASTILFFDDSLRNVEAARASGWCAEQVHGISQVEAWVQRYRER